MTHQEGYRTPAKYNSKLRQYRKTPYITLTGLQWIPLSARTRILFPLHCLDVRQALSYKGALIHVWSGYTDAGARFRYKPLGFGSMKVSMPFSMFNKEGFYALPHFGKLECQYIRKY